MKLHRLRLTAFRGVADRDVTFPDSGVVVVSGANEIGKSSMVEALGLLFDSKDRSRAAEVTRVKPTHADLGAEITAEISTGPYHFTYFKRFHKRCETRLSVTAPRAEQLTGDEAHERVQAILDETLDRPLWQALQALQSASLAPVDLSGSDALSRALDVAAGQAADASGGASSLLVDHIAEQYGRYFTRTGRPTGEYAAARGRVAALREQVTVAEAAVAEIDDAVGRHAEMTSTLRGAADEVTAAAVRHDAAVVAADAVAALRTEAAHADAEAEAAGRAATAARERHDGRLRDRAGVAELERGNEALAEELSHAHAAAASAATRVEDTSAAAAAARHEVATAEDAERVARAALDATSDRAEATRIESRLARIDAAAAELDALDGDLASIVLTESLADAVEAAARQLATAAARAESAAAHVELVALSGVTVEVDGRPVVLAAGDRWDGAPTDLVVADVLRARIVPGAPAARIAAEHTQAVAALADALQAAGVDGVERARELLARRRDLTARRAALVERLDGLVDDDEPTDLRERLALLRDRHGDPADDASNGGEEGRGTGVGEARARFDAACEHRAATARAAAAAGREADAATAAAGTAALAVASMAERHAGGTRQLGIRREQLATARAEHSDDALALDAERTADTHRRRVEAASVTRARVVGAAPAAVDAERVAAAAALDAARRRHTELTGTLRDLSVRLSVWGTEGRRGRLDEASTELAHAEAEEDRLGRAARAAKLLRETVEHHRTAARERCVDPFRHEVERLGRLVFGDSFAVDVDAGLNVCTRTLDGRTVPYASLSGGAREQLGIVARLAGASLVAEEETVPVILDDALGFTDADRLTGMASVFDAVGGAGQVIVLTCAPERYAGIEGVHHIRLGV